LEDPNTFLIKALSCPDRAEWLSLERVTRMTGRTTTLLVQAARDILRGEMVVLLVSNRDQGRQHIATLFRFLDCLAPGVYSEEESKISLDGEWVFRPVVVHNPPGIPSRIRGMDYTILLNGLY